MTVYLTSFKRWHSPDVAEYLNFDPNNPPARFSIAVYQPHWYPPLPKLDLFDIRSEAGAWIRPRLFEGQSDPLYRYHERLLLLYRQRRHNGDNTDITLRKRDAVLCCWCPYDKAAKRQLEEHGSFVCHSWPVESFLRELGIDVVRDTDRERMVRCTWQST